MNIPLRSEIRKLLIVLNWERQSKWLQCMCVWVCACVWVGHWSWNHTQLQSWASFSPKSFCIIYDSLSAAKLPGTTKPRPTTPPISLSVRTLPVSALPLYLSLSLALSDIFHINSLFKNVTRNSKVCQVVWRSLAAGRQTIYTTHTHIQTQSVSQSVRQSVRQSMRPSLPE